MTPNFSNQNFANDTIHPQYDESHQNLNYNQSSSTHATHEESGFTQVPFSHQPNSPHVNDQHDSYNRQDESFNSTYNFENLDPNAILEESNQNLDGPRIRKQRSIVNMQASQPMGGRHA